MKKGLSLVELAQEIERQNESKKDFLADTSKIEVVVDDNKDVRLGLGSEVMVIGEVAHDQIAAYTSIPKTYYSKMRASKPELLATNIKTWFDEFKEERMVRTLDTRARAFLSNGYRPLENGDLANAILPVLLALKLEIMSCEITEQRMYIKAVDERIKKDVPSGRKIGDGSHVFFDTCSPAITISNSEVGQGMLSVETGIFTKVCTNLATFADGGMKKRHVGARSVLTEGETIQHLLSDDTKRATDKAIWMQITDVVKGAFDEMKFQGYIDKMAGMAKEPISGDPIKVIDIATKKLGLTQEEGTSILQHLISGGDLTKYGFFNAVTRTAEDLGNYDRASEFERIGGKIIELPRHEWRRMNEEATLKKAA